MVEHIEHMSMLQLVHRVFYDRSPLQDTLIISIQEPGEGNGIEFTKSGRVKDVLNLRFEDIDTMKYDIDEDSYHLFTEADALQIKNFLEQYEGDGAITTILIHCHAGVSRSGAVALALKEYFHLPTDKMQDDDYVVINLHTYYTLSKSLQLPYNPKPLKALKALEQKPVETATFTLGDLF